MRKRVVFDDSSSSSEEGNLSEQHIQNSEQIAMKKGSLSFSNESERESHSPKALLFSSSSDDDDGEDATITSAAKKKEEKRGSTDVLSINKAYAEKYNEVKRAKELHSLTSKYGKRMELEEGNDSDEEDEEDDDAVLLTKEKELAFAKALYAVRHPEEVGTEMFFSSPQEQVASNARAFEEALKKKRTKGKERFLADEYRSAVRASASGKLLEDEIKTVENTSGSKKLVPRNEKEKALREAFLKSAAEVEDFSVFPKEREKGDNKDGEDDEEEDKERSETRRLIEKAMSNGEEESTNEEEVFLKNFFVNELWKADKHSNDSTLNFQALAEEDELDAFYDDAEEWERKFQEKKYRHEEDIEAVSHVSTFPRPIGEAAQGLLRKQDTSRKDARQRRRERIAEARLLQVEELKRLKHLKKQEIERQRALIASVAGLIDRHEVEKEEGVMPVYGEDDKNSNSRGKGANETRRRKKEEEEEKQLAKLKEVWSEKDFDAPFDPVEFDKKMNMIFNDDYYDERNVDENEIEFMEAELDGADDVPLKELTSLDAIEGNTVADGQKGGCFSHRHGKKEIREELWETPDLFLVDSLEEAKKAKLSRTPPPSGDLASFPDYMNDADDFSSSDALSLLYPSSTLTRMEGEKDQIEKEGRKYEGDMNYSRATDKNRDGHQESSPSGEEVLEKLQKELKEKEDAYYRLHQESGTTLPFRYREVPSEDFCLSVEEILARDDRQLNMIAPMNCYAAYLDKASNERDRRRIENRWRRGFREMDSSRRSRRYGEVGKTAVLDENMTEEDAKEIAERLRQRLENEEKLVLQEKDGEKKEEKNTSFRQKKNFRVSYSESRPKKWSAPSVKRFKRDLPSYGVSGRK